MLYSTEYQAMKYFSAMPCHNIVPQKKTKTELGKKCSHRDLNIMFRLILLIYRGKMQIIYRGKIVNLTENRFLQLVTEN